MKKYRMTILTDGNETQYFCLETRKGLDKWKNEWFAVILANQMVEISERAFDTAQLCNQEIFGKKLTVTKIIER